MFNTKKDATEYAQDIANYTGETHFVIHYRPGPVWDVADESKQPSHGMGFNVVKSIPVDPVST